MLFFDFNSLLLCEVLFSTLANYSLEVFCWLLFYFIKILAIY